MNRQQQISEILSLLSTFVESASEQDLRRLRSFLSKPSNVGKNSKSERHSQDSAKWEQLADKMRAFNTREQGTSFLLKSGFTRIELEAFAKSQDIHVVKTDKADKIVTKIVEGLIGSRLASHAVRGRTLS